MRKQIVTAGTEVQEFERDYVVDAVNKMGDPDHFNDYVKKFEQAFADKIGVKYAFAVTNGTAALHLGLLALGVGPGDEVILPDMTYVACANVIHYCGATPVFADIDPVTWTLDPESVKKNITKKTKAIMPVWMYGGIPDMGALKKFGIPIIEDSCPAYGSYWFTHHAGTIGDVGCFSFQGAKVLAVGEGGMVVTNSKKLMDKMRPLADMSITNRQFWHDGVGYMYEMAPLLAAVGLGQLQHADEMVAKKRQIYKWYRAGLDSLYPMNKEVPACNYWMSSILTPSHEHRDDLRKYLSRQGIDTRPFFYPISMFGIWKAKRQTPISHDIGLCGINLPSRVDLTISDAEYIINHIKTYAGKNTDRKTYGFTGEQVAEV